MRTLRYAFSFMKPYKKSIMITLIGLIILQILSMITPLVVRDLIDNQILGIEQPFYQVYTKDEKSVEYHGKYYRQLRHFTDGDEISHHLITVIYIENHFYVVEGRVTDGVRSIRGSTLEVMSGEQVIATYDVEVIDSEQIGSFFKPRFNEIYFTVGILIAIPILQMIVSIVQRKSFSNVIVDITGDCRKLAANKLHKIPMSYFESEPSGRTANRIITDVNGPPVIFEKLITLGFNATLGFILAFAGMFYLDARLALITLTIIPIFAIWSFAYVRWIRKITDRINEVSAELVSRLNEYIKGISIIRLFNFERGAIENYDSLGKQFIHLSKKELKIHLTIGWNMVDFLRGLVIGIVVLYFGVTKISTPYVIVTAGTIYAYQDYLVRILTPISMLFHEFGNIEHAASRTDRLHHLLSQPEEDDEKQVIEKYDGKVTFDHVWYGYQKDKYVLKDISFTVEPGQMLGIVGHTGSGKSTLMNLLMRFQDLKPTDIGNIYVDDISIQQYPKRTYRQHIGMILQDPVLFKGTVASNIRYAAPHLSDSKVEQLLLQLGGKEILKKFTSGIHQPISHGGYNLSLGERQIIAFARVLATDPAILIMDEATANIDSETEQFIQGAIEALVKGRTMIVIAHRLSTIQKADNIIVLREGVIVESGAHQTLLQKRGYYAQMYYAQDIDVPLG